MRPVEDFVEHLERCTDCRDRAFKMCSPGSELLRGAAAYLRQKRDVS